MALDKAVITDSVTSQISGAASAKAFGGFGLLDGLYRSELGSLYALGPFVDLGFTAGEKGQCRCLLIFR